MADSPKSKKSVSPDWLVQGVLAKLGDKFDKFLGRDWKPSSSLATSELIERLKALLDSEAEMVDGRGPFVPHNIKLKMQWDKFSTDAEASLRKLEHELLTAAVDHINDRRYYTHKPLSVEAKADYFTSGVRLQVSFERFNDNEDEASVNVGGPTGVSLSGDAIEAAAQEVRTEKYRFVFAEQDKPKSLELLFETGRRRSVGRTRENDIFIDDPTVSKLHASLALNEEGDLLLADTGSTNGTFVNGRRMAYGNAETINASDKLMFGTVEVSVEHLPKPEQREVPVTEAPTVAIGEFEFTSKTPGEVDVGENNGDDGEGNDPNEPEPARTENIIDFDFSESEAASEK